MACQHFRSSQLSNLELNGSWSYLVATLPVHEMRLNVNVAQVIKYAKSFPKSLCSVRSITVKWVQSRSATLGLFTAIYCSAFNPCTNFYLHSSGLFQTDLFLHTFYAQTTLAATQNISRSCSAFTIGLHSLLLQMLVCNVSSGQSTLNKFFSARAGDKTE